MTQWMAIPIRDLFASSVPGDWGTEPTEDQSTQVLRSTNIRNDGTIDYSDIVQRRIDPARLARRSVRRNSILIEKSGGGPKQAAGRVAFCDSDFVGTASNFIEIVTVAENSAPHFVAYLLQHLYRSGLVMKYQQQTTGIINFKLNEYVDEVVPVPEDKNDQIRIARVLSIVDRAIAQTEALMSKRQRLKAGLMQDLLTRGVDEKGNVRSEKAFVFVDSDIGRFPQQWDVFRLDTAAVRGSGHTPNKRKAEYWNGGIKWVSLADSRRLDNVWIDETDKEISALGLQNSSAVLHPRGSVILSRDAGVGKSAILHSDMAVSQHFMAWRCKPAKLNNLYLYYWLQKDKPKFEGIASGSTIVTIGLQFFREYQIAAPRDVAEQERIANVLHLADLQLQELKTELDKLLALKAALMQDLLTGRRRVSPSLTVHDVNVGQVA